MITTLCLGNFANRCRKISIATVLGIVSVSCQSVPNSDKKSISSVLESKSCDFSAAAPEGARGTPEYFDGKIIGFRLTNLSAENSVAQLGLKNNDTILKCNEIVTNSPSSMMDCFSEMTNKKSALTIKRNGEPKTILVDKLKLEPAEHIDCPLTVSFGEHQMGYGIDHHASAAIADYLALNPQIKVYQSDVTTEGGQTLCLQPARKSDVDSTAVKLIELIGTQLHTASVSLCKQGEVILPTGAPFEPIKK